MDEQVHVVRSVCGPWLASVVHLSSIQVLDVEEEQTGPEELQQELTLGK